MLLSAPAPVAALILQMAPAPWVVLGLQMELALPTALAPLMAMGGMQDGSGAGAPTALLTALAGRRRQRGHHTLLHRLPASRRR